MPVEENINKIRPFKKMLKLSIMDPWQGAGLQCSDKIFFFHNLFGA